MILSQILGPPNCVSEILAAGTGTMYRDFVIGRRDRVAYRHGFKGRNGLYPGQRVLTYQN